MHLDIFGWQSATRNFRRRPYLEFGSHWGWVTKCKSKLPRRLLERLLERLL